MTNDARQRCAPNHIGLELPHFILETVVAFKLKRGSVWIARKHGKFAWRKQVRGTEWGLCDVGKGSASFAADDDAC